MRQLDVAVRVLQHVGAGSLEYAFTAAREARGVTSGRDLVPAGFDAHQPHVGIVNERIEDADGVAAATDAGNDGIGQPSGLVEHLSASFAPDHRLELSHHEGIGMRTQHRAEQVVGVGGHW